MDLREAEARYGKIVNGVWVDETKWCISLQIPDDIANTWINSATLKPTKRVYCNVDLADPLLRSLINVRNRGLIHELETFDGCFNIRDVRGEQGKVSAHAYAIAIDINASKNPLGKQPLMSLPFAQCFKDEGFEWGAEFKRVDGMHLTLGW